MSTPLAWPSFVFHISLVVVVVVVVLLPVDPRQALRLNFKNLELEIWAHQTGCCTFLFLRLVMDSKCTNRSLAKANN